MRAWHWADIPVPVPLTLTPGEKRGQGRATRGCRERSLLPWLMWMRAGCLESLSISSPFAIPAWGFICVLKDAHGDPHVCVNRAKETKAQSKVCTQDQPDKPGSNSQTLHWVIATQHHWEIALLEWSLCVAPELWELPQVAGGEQTPPEPRWALCCILPTLPSLQGSHRLFGKRCRTSPWQSANTANSPCSKHRQGQGTPRSQGCSQGSTCGMGAMLRKTFCQPCAQLHWPLKCWHRIYIGAQPWLCVNLPHPRDILLWDPPLLTLFPGTKTRPRGWGGEEPNSKQNFGASFLTKYHSGFAKMPPTTRVWLQRTLSLQSPRALPRIFPIVSVILDDWWNCLNPQDTAGLQEKSGHWLNSTGRWIDLDKI